MPDYRSPLRKRLAKRFFVRPPGRDQSAAASGKIGPALAVALAAAIGKSRVAADMQRFRVIFLILLLSSTPASAWAQPVISPAPAKTNDVYHLDTSFGYRRPLNGDYDWWLPVTITFGKMMNDHNTLDAAVGGGLIQLKSGSAADAQAQQPFFLELGIGWKHFFAPREAPVKLYVTAGASLLWLSWEYRNPVDSPNFGRVTRDLLEGADGYAGAGLSLQLRPHLQAFAEVAVGGVGFLSTTHSGEHNDLFENFGYAGFRGGLSLTF